MKASEFIKILEHHIKHYGDSELVIDACTEGCEDDGGCDVHDDLGHYAASDSEHKFMIECAATHRQFVSDEIAASEGYYEGY